MVSSDGKRLELDFYIQELDVAIEIQGSQHYQYVKFFHHTEDGFAQRVKSDNEKKGLCRRARVRLYEASNEQEFLEIVKEIRANEYRQYVQKEGHYEGKTIEILSDKSNSLISKICAVVYYMYYHFLNYGTLYPEENAIIRDFYMSHKSEIDRRLNNKFKGAKTIKKIRF